MMVILSYVFSFCTIAMEYISFFYTCDFFFKRRLKRHPKIVTMILMALSAIVFLYIINYFFGQSPIRALFVVFVFSCIAIAFFSGKIYTQIICSIVFYCILYLLDLAAFAAVAMVNNITFSTATQSPLMCTYATVISKILLFVVFRSFTLLMKKSNNDYLKFSDWLLLLIIPLTSFFTIIVSLWQSMIDNVLSVWVTIDLILLMLVNIIIFYIVEKIATSRRTQFEKELLERQMKAEKENFLGLKETHEQLSKFAHDFSNHMDSIEGMLSSGENAPIREYIEKMSGQIEKDIITVNSGNIALDALLHNKMSLARRSGTKLHIVIEGDMGNLPIDDFDLNTIISNALDNAIEACAISERKGQIRLTIKNTPSELIIAVKNPVDKKVVIENNRAVTSKKDKKRHGIGLGNIQAAIEKNNGKLTYESTEDTFVLMAII